MAEMTDERIAEITEYINEWVRSSGKSIFLALFLDALQALKEERERADTNWQSYERIKSKYEESHQALKEARAELAEIRLVADSWQNTIETQASNYSALERRECQARAERDEARRLRDKFESLLIAANATSKRRGLERDAARAEVAKLRDALVRLEGKALLKARMASSYSPQAMALDIRAVIAEVEGIA
jgi:chromosome segregation ATPase